MFDRLKSLLRPPEQKASRTARLIAIEGGTRARWTPRDYAALARDMVMRGAFADTLRMRGINRIPMLFQHDPSEPIGVWLELREDSRGLFARGRLIPEVARARELLSLLRAGAVDGLSIGFRTVKGTIDPRTRVRRLLAVELWEISIVTFPLLAGARVRAVKQATSPPMLSHARTRAEREWAKAVGDCNSVEATREFRRRRPRVRRG